MAQNDRRVAGTLPKGWVSTTLENCVDILDSRRIPVNASQREQRIAGRSASDLYPYFGATGQVGWIDGYLFDEELVLLGEDGAPFLEPFKSKAYMIRGKTWVNNHAHVLRALAGLASNSYLCHYLNATDYQQYVTGTTRLKLNQGRMRKIPVPLAPLPEQHRIVAEIETQFTRLDAGVAALKRTQAKLRRYKAAVLQAACEGRLVPTEAELVRAEGRDYEPADILLQRILAERRTKWDAENPGRRYTEPAQPDTSDLPQLPEGWGWATVEQLASSIPRSIQSGPFGSALLHSEFQDEGILAIGIDNVLDGLFSLGKQHRVSPKKYATLRRFSARPLDFVITVMATVGRCCVLPPNLETAIITKHIYRVTVNQDLIDPYYLMYAFSGDREILRQLHQEMRGQTRPGINGSILKRIAVPVPTLSEQHRILAEVDRRLSVVRELEKQIEVALRRAERLRQAILKRAFEGKLVPQDPNDEPASALLARIQAGVTTPSAASKAPSSTPAARKPQQLELF